MDFAKGDGNENPTLTNGNIKYFFQMHRVILFRGGMW